MKLLISVVKLRLLSGRRVYLYLLGDRSSFICLHALICISFCFFVEDSRFVSNRRVLTTHFHCLLSIVLSLIFLCMLQERIPGLVPVRPVHGLDDPCGPVPGGGGGQRHPAQPLQRLLHLRVWILI